MLKKKFGPVFEELENFLPKNLSLSSQRDPGSGKMLFRIPDPGLGVNKAPDPGSGSLTLKKIQLKFCSYFLFIKNCNLPIPPRPSVPDPWHFGVDPDPAIFVIDFQEASEKLIFQHNFFCLLLFEGTLFTLF